MKKITLLLSALFVAALVNAQSTKEEVDLMQASFGMEKKVMVAEFVQVDPVQKDAFWKLYDEYETARKALGQERIHLLSDYTAKYDKFTSESAEAWTKNVINLSKETDDLIITYYNKIKKVTNPIVALQFYQVENYILAGIRVSLLESLPLPDLKNQK
jgi:predicted nucleic acid-binding OB-fold protein